MPKLLSKKEMIEIGTKMAEEYGLAFRNDDNTTFIKTFLGRVDTRRVFDWFPWYLEDHFTQIREIYADNFEEALTKLQYELSEFDSRTKIAEQFREKYAMQEADEALDKALKDK